MNTPQPTADVGVIVGRFQVHELHDGHRELIDEVLVRHQKVIIFLGSTPGVLVTRRNPLDFGTRKIMIQESYPSITVLPIPDQPTDVGWSRDLDRRIREVTEASSVLLYGSRDGFIPAYCGDFETIELAATKNPSGTQVRASISNDVRASAEFRRGIIYAAYNRHPTSFQTTDAAVIRNRGTIAADVLLGRKATDPNNRWRFFGGFVHPTDYTLEFAASRELHEETSHGLSVHVPPTYLGSHRVGDWRYRPEQDGILTALFVYDYLSGAPQAGDDIDEVRWFSLQSLTESHFVEEHRPLFQLLSAHLQGGGSKDE